MKQVRQLGRERNLFRASLNAATFGLLFAFATLSIAKTPPGYAGESTVREPATTMRTGSTAAQATDVTPVPPFVGTQSETWEEFPVEKFGSAQISILGDTATISGTELEIATNGMFLLCTVVAIPSDGTKFLGATALIRR